MAENLSSLIRILWYNPHTPFCRALENQAVHRTGSQAGCERKGVAGDNA